MATLLTTCRLWSELYSCELPEAQRFLFQFPSLHCPSIHYWFLVPSFYSHFFYTLADALVKIYLFFSLQISPILSSSMLHFFIKHFPSLKTCCLWSTSCLTGISPPALFSQDLVSLFKENFTKLWKNCSALSYSPLYLTIFIPIFQLDHCALTSSQLISFSSHFPPPTSESLVSFIQPQKWGPLEKQLFLYLHWTVLAIPARKYHIKHYSLSRWSLNVTLVLYL